MSFLKTYLKIEKMTLDPPPPPLKSKKLQKWPKKGKKLPFFGPPGPNFAKIKKRLRHSLTFTPERLYTKFQKIWLIRLGENALQTDGRTDGRTDGTEIIGPSGKIPVTNYENQLINPCTKHFYEL